MHINMERYGKGKKIIFIHGSGLSTHIWYGLRDYLSNSLEVVLIDLPGHGMSSGGGYGSIEDYRDAIFNAIKGTDLEGSYMAGHSLGGAIAMSFALKYPELIKGLILLGTGARLKVLPQILEGIVKNKEKTLKEIISLAFSDKSHDELKKIHYNETIKCPGEVIYKDFFACDRFNIMDSLEFIASPTLIVCGEDDKLTPVKYSEYLKNHIKNSELVIIKDAGHMLFLEKPKEIADAIKGFIEKKPQ
ncbi:MAG TPA: alpha/beta hydrolase [Syntrophorhabdaceae bacterium]|nr:alpha/beta hydrolase [Syntrophorhabdaceae bacterium]